MASTRLTRTPSSTTNQKIWTFSVWLKRSGLTEEVIFNNKNTGGSGEELRLFFKDDDLKFQSIAGGYDFQYITNRKFRDTSGWYHIVCSVDTTQTTPADRIKIYVNGVQETSFSTATNPSSDVNLWWNTNTEFQIGSNQNPNDWFNGVMSHINNIDGTAYDATAFGETDATTGEWKIKTSPSVTYGTNGFFILKNGNSVTDQSGNGNNFTVAGGTLTNTLDCPDNVFATANPLNNYTGQVFGNGNTTVGTTSGNTSHKQFVSTLGVSSGKYYWELKNIDATTTDSRVGVSSENVISNPANLTGSDGHVGDDAESYGYVASSGNKETNNSQSSYGNPFTSGDILMIALDMDNNKLYFGKNGTWQNSGDPTSGATGTGAAFTVTSNITYFPAVSIYGASEDYSFNFGNGYFGTSAVTSAGTAGSTPGTFEYDVPSGYEPLTTKGLNA